MKLYRHWKLVDPTDNDTFEVYAREIDIGLVGWYAWFERHGPEITWIRGLYVVQEIKG